MNPELGIDLIDNDGKDITKLDLYQHYRPMTWNQMVGQRSTVSALRKYVQTDKLPAAFIFAGKHGCGKTTAAFILARALNCPNVDAEGNPCNTCDVCRSIVMEQGAGFAGFQFKAASNMSNGIDDVRSIIQQSYNRSTLKHPVFIIDEFQVLRKSAGAYQEFLAPLESGLPALFIFCTTDINDIKKSSSALVSRCTSFSFGEVSGEDMFPLCRSILENEGYSVIKGTDGDIDNKIVSTGQISNAINAGGGSVRDTLTNLSTVIMTGRQAKVDDLILLLSYVFHKKNRGMAIKTVMDASTDGVDIQALSASFADACGRMLVLADGGDVGRTDNKAIITVSKEYKPKDFSMAMTVVGEAMANMTWGAGDPRIYLEIALMKIIDNL